MGQDKAFIEVDGVPIILRIFAVFDRLFRETIIVANEKEPYTELNIPVYSDLVPGQGALGGPLYRARLLHFSILFLCRVRYAFPRSSFD